MTQRSAFQAQILEKIGAPLLVAVAEGQARQSKDSGDQKQEAARLAELLNKTVQVSIGLAGSMALKDSDGDAVRLALAALASPLIAGQYRLTGKVPGDAEIRKLVKALEAVLTFSDNFAPAAENTVRLDNLSPGMPFVDESQVHIQYVGALVPVVNAIAAFSFGRAENKLAQEIAGRLVQKSKNMGEALQPGEAEPAARKRAELQLLRALAALYVECHEREMNRLLALDDQARMRAAEGAGGVLPLEPVWEAFERRAAMAEIIGRSAAPGGAITGENSGAGKAPGDKPRPPSMQDAAPPPPVSGDEAQKAGAYNPMAFFKSKDDNRSGEYGEGG